MGEGANPLGNQHGSGATPQGPPLAFGELPRQTSPNFGVGAGGVFGGGFPGAGSGGRLDSGEPSGSRRKRSASEPRVEPTRRTEETASGLGAGQFRQFLEEMFHTVNSGGKGGGRSGRYSRGGKNRECGFLDDKRYEHIHKFKGEHEKLQTFMFDFFIATGRCCID